MFATLGRSWNLTRESYRVLMMDKELMMFPVVSAVMSLVLLASFFVPLSLAADWSTFGQEDFRIPDWLLYLLMFVFYFLTSVALVFCNVAMLHCAGIRFQGGDPTVMDGFRAGFAHLGHIVAWAAVSGTIGVVLGMIEERLGFLGSLLRGLLGAAWAVVSFFAVPVMVFENVGPFEAIAKSKDILRKTWGESLTAYVGFSAINGMLTFAGFAFLLATVLGGLAMEVPALAIGGAVVTVLYWLALGIVMSSLTQVFRAAVYQYAATGEVPKGYTEDLVKGAFQTR